MVRCSSCVKKHIKAILAPVPNYTCGTIIDFIKNYNIISFDVYDTLIKRNVYQPSDIFTMTARIYNASRMMVQDHIDENLFTNNRIKAEETARNNHFETEEISIGLIYRQLYKIYGVKVSNILMRLEIELEISCSYANAEIKSVFDWCLSNGKQVILISDMYLQRETLTAILENNGYNNFSLFLSSEIGLQKKTGSIYEYIVGTGIERQSVIHIGDDLLSDYLQSRKHGIKSIWIAKEPQRIEYTKKISGKTTKTARKLKVLLNNSFPTASSQYYKYGFEVFGPLLYGFTKWLVSNIKEDGVGKIYFFSRDGYIMFKAYQEFTECNAGKYFYASRKAFQIATLWMHPEIEYFTSMYQDTKVWTVKDLAGRIGVDAIECERAWLNSGLRVEDMVSNKEMRKNSCTRKFWEIISNKMIKNSREQYQLLREYIKQSEMEGNVAVVDIGWHGTMQRCLQSIFTYEKQDINVIGYYLGVADKVPDDIKMKYFIPVKEEAANGLMGILEMLFPSAEGSTIGYRKINETVIPVLDSTEYDDVQSRTFLCETQMGALDFIKKFRSNKLLDLNGSEAFAIIKRIGNRPTSKEARMLGECMFMDDGIVKIAKPKGILYYLSHPANFKYEFARCPWKIGFMKRMLLLPLPYEKIFKLLKRFSK